MCSYYRFSDNANRPNGKLIKALPKDFSDDVNEVLRKVKHLFIMAEF